MIKVVRSIQILVYFDVGADKNSNGMTVREERVK